jgi:hypothetical protein
LNYGLPQLVVLNRRIKPTRSAAKTMSSSHSNNNKSSVLSRELQAQLGPNALVVAPSRARSTQDAAPTTTAPKSKLTRKQRKRLEQLEYKRAAECKTCFFCFCFCLY